ncbi:MAG: hypothetical protein J7J98_02665 [candidate division Zixibacteria bacterium]|nr:hypothetical protein [candidate division Zixibacteria bacterium]
MVALISILGAAYLYLRKIYEWPVRRF